MSKKTIDTITALLLLAAIVLGTWFGAAMQSAIVGLIAVVFLCGLALIVGGSLMYALGPGVEHSRRFGQTMRDD